MNAPRPARRSWLERSSGSRNMASRYSEYSLTTVPATARGCSPRRATSLASEPHEPGPTGRAPTAKPDGSSKPCSASGPTSVVTTPATNATWNSHTGSTTTTTDDHTAPSVTNPRSRGYAPPDQRDWELQLVHVELRFPAGRPDVLAIPEHVFDSAVCCVVGDRLGFTLRTIPDVAAGIA
jgi:hypothetical protein